MSVFNGAVRLYLPGLSDETEDPYQHPLWLLQENAGQEFIQSIASRVLPFAFLRTHAREDFRQHNDRRSLERIISFRCRESITQDVDVFDEQALLPLQEIDSEKPASAGNKGASVVWHVRRAFMRRCSYYGFRLVR
jgi:hypothetical protein